MVNSLKLLRPEYDDAISNIGAKKSLSFRFIACVCFLFHVFNLNAHDLTERGVVDYLQPLDVLKDITLITHVIRENILYKSRGSIRKYCYLLPIFLEKLVKENSHIPGYIFFSRLNFDLDENPSNINPSTEGATSVQPYITAKQMRDDVFACYNKIETMDISHFTPELLDAFEYALGIKGENHRPLNEGILSLLQEKYQGVTPAGKAMHGYPKPADDFYLKLPPEYEKRLRRKIVEARNALFSNDLPTDTISEDASQAGDEDERIWQWLNACPDPPPKSRSRKKRSPGSQTGYSLKTDSQERRGAQLVHE